MDRRMAGRRKGFTLTELLVAIGIIVLLTSLTIGAVRLSVTTEVVRGGARQVQSLIEGARDRAIYAGEARGIRLLVDDADPTICRTIIYIGSAGSYESQPDSNDANFNGNREEPLTVGPPDANDLDGDGDTTELLPGGPFINVMNPDASLYGPGRELAAKALICVGGRLSDLAEQRLIRAGSRVRLGRDSLGEAQNSTELLTIHPVSFPIRRESEWFGNGDPLDIGSDDPNGNGWDDEVIFLTTTSQVIQQHGLGVTSPLVDGNWHFAIETEAGPLPSEEPSRLPNNCCIDLETSVLPPSWTVTNPDGTTQFSNRMDLLLTPGGFVTGQAAATGLIHLHICHTQDAIEDVPIDEDNRQQDSFGATIFTKSGRVNVHPIDRTSGNPWQFGIEGELAQ